MQNKAYNLGAQARDERKKTAILLKVTQCSKKCIWNPILNIPALQNHKDNLIKVVAVFITNLFLVHCPK